MSDDPAGACAIVCWTVCLELFGGICLDFASTTHSCTSRLCPRPFNSGVNDEVEGVDPGERDLLIPKSQTQVGTTAAVVHKTQPPPYPAMSQSSSGP